jgi:hypothetical protein
MNRLRKRGIYMQWNFIQPQRTKFFICRKMVGTGGHHLSEVSQIQKAKTPNTNTAILF